MPALFIDAKYCKGFDTYCKTSNISYELKDCDDNCLVELEVKTEEEHAAAERHYRNMIATGQY